jgi:hypothetical protein
MHGVIMTLMDQRQEITIAWENNTPMLACESPYEDVTFFKPQKSSSRISSSCHLESQPSFHNLIFHKGFANHGYSNITIHWDEELDDVALWW